MRIVLLMLATLAFLSSAWSGDRLDWIGVDLQDDHTSSKIWRGTFTSLNGEHHNVSDFYRPRNLLLSARATLAVRPQARVTWLVPMSADAGYQAPLYHSQASFSLGLGVAVRTSRQSLMSVQLHDALVIGGAVHEKACYDSYRRADHCGTGLAWRDYAGSELAERSRFDGARLQLRFTHKFAL